jgi:hypothetical protein
MRLFDMHYQTQTNSPAPVAGQTLRAHCAVLLAAAVLVACGRSDHDLRADALAAVGEAKRIADPGQGYQQLNKWWHDLKDERVCDGTSVLSGARRCGMPADVNTIVGDELSRLHIQAVRVGNSYAIEVLYFRGDPKLLAHFAPSILDAADRASGTPDDRAVLRIGGLLLSDGLAVPPDSRRAIGYLARAWAAGESHAANDAGLHFLSVHDHRDAYLWSLRCVAPCNRSDELEVSRLLGALQPRAASQAEDAADAPTVVKLDSAS